VYLFCFFYFVYDEGGLWIGKGNEI
jgi:hypothetical protein